MLAAASWASGATSRASAKRPIEDTHQHTPHKVCFAGWARKRTVIISNVSLANCQVIGYFLLIL